MLMRKLPAAGAASKLIFMVAFSASLLQLPVGLSLFLSLPAIVLRSSTHSFVKSADKRGHVRKQCKAKAVGGWGERITIG